SGTCGLELREGVDDVLGGLIDGHVLPDSMNMPANLLKARGHVGVATAVALKFRPPVVHVSPGCMAVLRAGVPPAAVNEYSELELRKCDIDLYPARAQLHCKLLSKSQAASMKSRTKRDLWLGIEAAVAAHHRRDRDGFGVWIVVRPHGRQSTGLLGGFWHGGL